MTMPTPAERALYTDITALLMRMKGESLALVEVAIEERFQEFVRSQRCGGSARLQIVQSYTIHDDVEPWTEYRTEYRIATVDGPAAHTPARAVARPASAAPRTPRLGKVVPFPRAFVPEAGMGATASEVAGPRGS